MQIIQDYFQTGSIQQLLKVSQPVQGYFSPCLFEQVSSLRVLSSSQAFSENAVFSSPFASVFWSPIGVDHIRQCRQGFQSSMNSRLAAAVWLAVHLSLFFFLPRLVQHVLCVLLGVVIHCERDYPIFFLPHSLLPASFKDPLFC